ncbi:MAG: restriction endonuclease subunit R [Armatimonadetes bacterium CG_4_10_14_3_um_filter_66_18]|nr:DEAD/DEAH box helicase family protein [Armatimonadota bacterium]PIU91218.1 MAG: restriction endonuclease subunit R [Armatimonadetes bacterium CG06_land_8_20_14_3_00_66_21]PIX43959.1 MAG: restriction endonuclease subunit R [Armatimonadetes bacterium CG_4_8_14_3_um_filter_66_20]PIY51116.1 MAG: restriction endonuclease subunit R [Armatimonadetes bacterium CG_4_10_14_3_um_filter_66_18]PJB75234.1 MAG: restriction endonuclease subunit R [Armatimonadetes bacterium CG_4_9_14_3_um_filter_66_14]
MKQVVIENPVINSPFEEPLRHFQFDDDGITDEIVEGRRVSAYFVPIARPKKKSKQLSFDADGWTEDRLQENQFINQVRERVALWRKGVYTSATTRTTARLLEYWQRSERERKLFFCQLEALETAIYLTEVAGKHGDAWLENALRAANDSANPLLYRLAFKMATGSGKTLVMAMLIAWQLLNKLANRQDARFADTFLIVTPGITIRDRLRVLLPSDPANFYRQHDLVPPDLREELGKARILITNFHAFKQRERMSAGKLTKDILASGGTRRQGETSAFTETPGEMVRRVCRELGNKRNIVVLNDEAHHCYRRKPDGETEKLTGDDRKEAQQREEEARVWISGLEAVKAKLGIRVCYDLSATPFFLRGSGYDEGTLFPWVASDFSLIDAIESGIVKVPRVPVEDNTMRGVLPTYRNIWPLIREGLPRKGRKTVDESKTGLGPTLPKELEGALRSLYENYEKYHADWAGVAAQAEDGSLATPPVFIVVCNNTNVSKLVYDYVAGWERTLPDESTVLVPGALPLFSNVVDGVWRPRPNTILIDSQQLESGEAMSADFKKIAARAVADFKEEYRQRFPGRDVESLTDEDLLREVMNTVGKPGKLGEQVRCVVSVSMLTEGWDANTVTHILGVRAFGTQLLCEQVVGRGLRRRSYAAQRQTLSLNGSTVEFDAFPVEYAEVYGVPFSFIPCAGSSDPQPGPAPKRVRALEERFACEITFPRVMGYRYELGAERLAAQFAADSVLTLTTEQIPTKTENAPIVGESSIHTLEDLHRRREQEVAFLLAKLVLEKYFRQDGTVQAHAADEHRFDSEVQLWRFPEVLQITREWLAGCVHCKDNTFPQLLLLIELAHQAADRIYRAVVASAPGQKRLLPILRPYDTVGSTKYVDFETTRPRYETRPDKSHVSHVVGDTESWEQKMAQALEEMPEVVSYVRNHNLGFTIPYTVNNQERNYIPDFLARLDDGQGKDDLLNLIIEVTGQKDTDKEAKVATARSLWVPAVNNHGGFGRWEFVEVRDPWAAQQTIRDLVEARKETP